MNVLVSGISSLAFIPPPPAPDPAVKPWNPLVGENEQCLLVTLAMPPGPLQVIAPKGHQSFPLVIPLVIITFICNHNSYTTTTSVIHSSYLVSSRCSC